MLRKLSGNVIIFNPVGDLDGGIDCESIIRDFRSLIASGYRNFVVNFTHVRLVNSHGISCLIGAKKTVDQAGGNLVLCCLDRRKLSTIYKLRLEEVFGVAEKLQDALEVIPASDHQPSGVDQ